MKKKKTNYLLTLFFFMGLAIGLDCDEGEVDLGWGNCNLFFNDNMGCMESGCFSISETTQLNYSYIFLGDLPYEIGLLTNLNYIHLSDCGISGQIPPTIGNLEDLISIQIYDNNHDLPDSLNMDIDSNLSGEIPMEIGNLQSLQQLQLNNNHLQGEIPLEIGNLSNLLSLNLSGNQLVGEIPDEIMNLSNLKYLSLSNNQLNGLVPPNLEALSGLEILDINNNFFEGGIPKELGNLSSLIWLSLSGNQLSGYIPTEITNLESVYLLDLSSNNFEGPIPSNLDNMSLWTINLSNNQLFGEIPSDIGNIETLESLFLDNNQLSGEIPHDFSNLELNYLTLNNNQLSGEVPAYFCNVFSIDISNNNFCPEYPECIEEEELGYQDMSSCIVPGSSCILDNGDQGFFDCELCCWDIGLLSWLGDGYCDQQGGCAWEGPQFDCMQLSFDCGDCQSYENNPSGLCSECLLDTGDLNQDLIVNVLDVILLVNCILDDTCDQCSDINGDESFDVLDIIQLVNIIIN